MNSPQPADSGPPAAGASARPGDATAPIAPGGTLGLQRDDVIGRYRLLEKIGEGGWGVVYLAEQREKDFRRAVALKVIRVGMDTEAVIARFEAERQALALMDHPNIAKVLDAGTTAAGRPYFVMELVRGMRITDYCDQNLCSTRERLELFLQVCLAIQHAHQKGIIHRDIKPSNILVTIQDGRPVPKVIDFGIAKSMHGPLTTATVYTGLGQFIGTPAYMSPEQAELSGLDIDTRSDIYSLGVVLYELMTGRTPVDPKTLKEASIDEVRRMIREVDPQRPSTCVGTLPADDVTRVAKHHGVAPAQLSAQLRGDLDWIVMKALEKQRNRRYGTVADFAADIGRHLADEPVTARPPSAAYRMRKFIVRHKVGAVAIGAVAAALLAGAGISTWQALRAREAQRVAEENEADARRSRDRADDLLAFMLGDLRTQLDKVGRIDVLEAVAVKAMAYYADVGPHGATDSTLTGWSKAQTLIGEMRMKEGRFQDALQTFAQAYDRTAKLALRNPGSARILYERAQLEFWLGAVHRKQGAVDSTREWLNRYRDTALALVAMEPGKREWEAEAVSGLHNVAVFKKDQGDLEGARGDFEKKLSLLKANVASDPNNLRLKASLADTESWLASLAEVDGRLPAALQHLRAEAQGLMEIERRDSGDMNCRFERARNLANQARVLRITGNVSRAKECLKESRPLIDTVVAREPQNRTWAKVAVIVQLREAIFARADGDMSAARQGAVLARRGLEMLYEANPRDVSSLTGLMEALRLEAELSTGAGESLGRKLIDRAVGLGRQAIGGQAGSDEVNAELAQCLVAAAVMAEQDPGSDYGRTFARQALQLLESRLEDSKYWRIVDPAVRVFSLLGLDDRRASLQAHAELLGYHPVLPWPSNSRHK